MSCASPYVSINLVFPCGQCLPCRKNKAFEWAARQDIEAHYTRAILGRASSFITLTYRDDELPSGGSINPEHGQRFMRSLRQRLARHGGEATRFYLVAEYGSKTSRPHFHVNLFGYAPDDMVGSLTFKSHVASAWGRGFVYVLPFLQGAGHYTSGYVTKGLHQAHAADLKGRHPEYRRASLKPGLAAPALDLLAASIQSSGYASPVDRSSSIDTLQLGDRSIHLHGYMLKRLRRSIGFSDDELRAYGRALVHHQSATMGAARLEIIEANEPAALGSAHTLLATARQLYSELHADRIARITASHHRIEALKKPIL